MVDMCLRVPGVRSRPVQVTHPGSQCWHVVSRALRFPVLGACTWDPVFLHREQVAVQRLGVTAGTEVHGCLGVVGGLQRERKVLFFLDLETLYPSGTSPFSVLGGITE